MPLHTFMHTYICMHELHRRQMHINKPCVIYLCLHMYMNTHKHTHIWVSYTFTYTWICLQSCKNNSEAAEDMFKRAMAVGGNCSATVWVNDCIHTATMWWWPAAYVHDCVVQVHKDAAVKSHETRTRPAYAYIHSYTRFHDVTRAMAHYHVLLFTKKCFSLSRATKCFEIQFLEGWSNWLYRLKRTQPLCCRLACVWVRLSVATTAVAIMLHFWRMWNGIMRLQSAHIKERSKLMWVPNRSVYVCVCMCVSCRSDLYHMRL
jgi:hypothetical protein